MRQRLLLSAAKYLAALLLAALAVCLSFVAGLLDSHLASTFAGFATCLCMVVYLWRW